MQMGTNYVFKKAGELPYTSSKVATAKGVGIKTILLLAITAITGFLSVMLIDANEVITTGVMLGGYLLSPILTFILSLIIAFKPNLAKILAIPYAVFEGLGIGSLAVIMIMALGAADAGLILGLALLITIAIFMGGALLYTSGIIKVGRTFRKIMLTLLIGIIISSLVIGIVSIFNPAVKELFYGVNSTLSLVISVVMVVIASVYTVISLDNANQIVEAGLDKNFEWYASFGIVLNIVWLFYEIVRLLLIILSRSRD